MSNQISRIRVTAQNCATRANFFSSLLFSFSPRVCIWSINKKSMMVLCLKQHCDLWAAKTFLLAENVAKGPGQYKFGPVCKYHLSLVTKNIIKVYKQVVGVLVILFAFCKFICVYNAFIFPFIFFGKSP